MIDVAAFKELYKVIYVDLYRFALCMLHHQQDAEDAVSEAVILAYENVHKLRKEEAFRSCKCMQEEAEKPRTDGTGIEGRTCRDRYGRGLRRRRAEGISHTGRGRPADCKYDCVRRI